MAKYNATIYQNATWVIRLTLKDTEGAALNLTNATGQSQIRAAYGDGTVLATPVVTISDGTNGILEVSLTEAQTALLKPTPTAKGGSTVPLPVYDVLLQIGDVIYRIIEGTVTVLPGVTQWTPSE